ncbi:MAG: Multidrug resistance protein MdtC [Candidatus Marinimicrobia bacterium]|nr:Multidrug resistance protein MdtC [Candidatus Neomarinimicrobiota bacterium]
MILSKTAIRRGITFTMIFLIVIGFGLFSLSRLKVDLFPDVTFPVIGVITQYEGVGPYDMENLVTRPMEEAVTSVENIETINSRSMSGTSILIIEFDWGTDMDQAEIDVRKNLDIVRDMLPEEVSDPITFAFDPSMQPIAFLALSSDQLGQAELREVAKEKIEPRIERIPGVASADAQGGLERQINVKVEPRELAAKGIDINQIINAIRMENLQIPGGQMEEGMSEYSVRTYGEFQSVDQIKKVVVGQKSNTPIHLEEVAEVVDGFKERNSYVRNNGKESVVLVVMKQSDANTVNATEAVLNAIPDLEEVAGSGTEIEVIYDLASFIKDSISNLTNTALQAFLLAGLVLLFFLRNVRSAIIVAVSIPVSVIATFFVMDQAGVTLNIISMAGLALATGMLVDNSIVVLENIFRHREQGEPIREAADEGTSEVSMAIIASTLTTLAVFVPILFVPGIAGVLFNDMAVTIVFSLTTSLFVALTLIPLMSSRMLKLNDVARKSPLISRITGWVTDLLRNLDEKYYGVLKYALGHRKTIVISAIVLFLISLGLFPIIGGEFMPETDEGMVQMSVERAVGTNLEETRKTFREIEQLVQQKVPEAENTYVNFGTGEGFSALFGTAAANKGEIMVRLEDLTERDRSQFEIQDTLRSYFDKYPGVNMSFSQGGGAMFGGKDIEVVVKGHDLEIGRELATRVEERLNEIEGIVDVEKSFETGKPEYQVHFDRDRLSAFGLSTASIARSISSYVGGTVASQYREGGDEYNIFVQLQRPFRNSKEDLSNLFISTPSGTQVPLEQVAAIEQGVSPVSIEREDQERVVAVSANVSGRDLRSATSDVQDALRDMSFPSEFRWEIGGAAEDFQESFQALGLAILAAIALVYMVMASQFESFLDPFVILFTIPLAFIGVLWALFITNTTLSVTALIGGMLLVGIVVNNGIVMIDYINQLREKHGYSLQEAALEGGRRRLRPVLMTAVTTILAMLPLSFGIGASAETWSPMARAVIGGLTVSTVLTLVVIPTLYYIFETTLLKRAAKKAAE